MYSKYINIINNYKREEIKTYYSVIAHESIECVFDLIINILKNDEYGGIVISLSNNLHNKITNIKFPEYILFSKPFDKSKVGVYISLACVKNYEKIKNKNFEYFVLLASNNLFVKKIRYDIIDKIVPKINKNPDFLPVPFEIDDIKNLDYLNLDYIV